MSKTKLTKELEMQIFYETVADRLGVYGAFEVSLGKGYGNEYVDFMTMTSSGEFRCYEIKVSKSDFHSKNKLSFHGDRNYFVMPQELYEEVKDEIPFQVGVYVYKDGKLKLVKKSSHKSVAPWERYMLTHCMVRSLSRLTTRLVKENVSESDNKEG